MQESRSIVGCTGGSHGVPTCAGAAMPCRAVPGCHRPGAVGKHGRQSPRDRLRLAGAKAFIFVSGQWTSTKRKSRPGSRVGFDDYVAESLRGM